MSADEQQTAPELVRNQDFVIPVDVVRTGVDRLVGEMQPTYRQRGFRKGRVPADLIRRQNLKELRAQALQDAVFERIREWDDETDRERRLGRPNVEFVGDGTLEEALTSEQDLAMRWRAEYLPEVPDIARFRLSVTRPVVEVTEADAEGEANALRDRLLPGEQLEEGIPVQDKDTLVVYALPANVAPRTDGPERPFALTLGDADLGADVDAALRGHALGDSVEAVGTLPGVDDAGKRHEPTRLELEIIGAFRPPPPALSDEVARYCRFADLEEMMEWARVEAKNHATMMERTILQGRLYAALSGHLFFDVPPSVLKNVESFAKLVARAFNGDVGWAPDLQRLARVWVARRAFFVERELEITVDDLIRAARRPSMPAPVTAEERADMHEELRRNAAKTELWHALASRKRFFDELAQLAEFSGSDSFGFDEADKLVENTWECREVLCLPG